MFDVVPKHSTLSCNSELSRQHKPILHSMTPYLGIRSAHTSVYIQIPRVPYPQRHALNLQATTDPGDK